MPHPLNQIMTHAINTMLLIGLLSTNVQANVLHWLSQPESAAGPISDGDIINPKISANGRYVSFFSFATNIVNNDTNGLGDLFVKDLQDGSI